MVKPLSLEVYMRAFTAVIERCPDTGLFIGYVPGFPGAHSQGETLDELQRNLAEVIGMLLEDGEPQFESEFIVLLRIEEYERLKEESYDDSPWTREELQALAWERVKHEDWSSTPSMSIAMRPEPTW